MNLVDLALKGFIAVLLIACAWLLAPVFVPAHRLLGAAILAGVLAGVWWLSGVLSQVGAPDGHTACPRCRQRGGRTEGRNP